MDRLQMMSAVQDVGYLMDPGLFSHDQKGKGKNTGQGPMMFVDIMIYSTLRK